jgi:translation initiation factor IF-2
VSRGRSKRQRTSEWLTNGGVVPPARVGTIDALKHVKKDIEEARKGSECGISFHGFDEIKVGDIIQTYEEVIQKRHL